jgi:hypothetical protein
MAYWAVLNGLQCGRVILGVNVPADSRLFNAPSVLNMGAAYGGERLPFYDGNFGGVIGFVHGENTTGQLLELLRIIKSDSHIAAFVSDCSRESLIGEDGELARAAIVEEMCTIVAGNAFNVLLRKRR